jgi:hypothetical protein
MGIGTVFHSFLFWGTSPGYQVCFAEDANQLPHAFVNSPRRDVEGLGVNLAVWRLRDK